MLNYPRIDPVIVHIGPLEPRWYGLMYLIGFVYGYLTIKRHYRWLGLKNTEEVDSILASVVVILLICSRTVYVIFYNWDETMRGPWWEPFAVWHGGLAFHGGFLGVVLGTLFAAKKYKMPWLRLTDVCALAAPLGLGFGRIANFINGELWGRVTNAPWGMIFPNAGPLPRHPSQLYESFLEGFVLFWLVRLVWRRNPRVGVTSATFILGYAFFRILVEFVREPDVQVGYVLGPFTMGQLLSAVMVGGGVFLLYYALTRGVAHNAPPSAGIAAGSGTTKKKK